PPAAPAKLLRFRDAQGLNFPLLSDPEKAVLTQWGAYGEKQLYGRTVTGVIRSTFVVDPDGKIARAMYGVRATGHVAKLRKDLGVRHVPSKLVARGRSTTGRGTGFRFQPVGVRLPPAPQLVTSTNVLISLRKVDRWVRLWVRVSSADMAGTELDSRQRGRIEKR